MITFLKGIIVGLGAVAPGLSGSILLVIFGFYQKIVSIFSNIFKDFKKNILFLAPLGTGMVLGVLIFSRLIEIPLNAFKMQTYYAFLGLILGTIPMLFKEVRKEGFEKKHYAIAACAFVLGAVFFVFNKGAFPEVQNPNFLQSVLLGVAVAAAYFLPGVDSFAILSTFGLYSLWLHSINTFDFSVLLPAAIGLAIGALLISFVFNKLFSKWYTITYSVIFGLFLSVILNFIINECPRPSLDLRTLVSFVLLIFGFAASIAFGYLEQIINYFKEKKKKVTNSEEVQASEANEEVKSSVVNECTEIPKENPSSSK